MTIAFGGFAASGVSPADVTTIVNAAIVAADIPGQVDAGVAALPPYAATATLADATAAWAAVPAPMVSWDTATYLHQLIHGQIAITRGGEYWSGPFTLAWGVAGAEPQLLLTGPESAVATGVDLRAVVAAGVVSLEYTTTATGETAGVLLSWEEISQHVGVPVAPFAGILPIATYARTLVDASPLGTPIAPVVTLAPATKGASGAFKIVRGAIIVTGLWEAAMTGAAGEIVMHGADTAASGVGVALASINIATGELALTYDTTATGLDATLTLELWKVW